MSSEYFQKWPSTDQFHTVARYIRKYRHAFEGPIEYVGTVKLHGTNAAVRLHPDEGTLVAQSRNRDLTVDDDNFGFARWVEEREVALHELFLLLPDNVVTIYGEYVGKGIQKNVALAECERHWVIFGAKDAAGNDVPLGFPFRDFPYLNSRGIYFVDQVPTVYLVLDPHGDDNHFKDLAEKLTLYTLGVETECPWASWIFEVKGVGEGLVWSPIGKHFGDSRLRFKTKGAKHDGSHKPAKVRSAPMHQDSGALAGFVEEYVTAARAEQMFREYCGGEASMRQTGNFLAAMGRDIKKESVADLEGLGLDWKAAAKAVTRRSRDIWMDFIRTGEWK